MAHIGHRRPTGLTNDASLLAPNCANCMAIVQFGAVYCTKCSAPAPEECLLPGRGWMVAMLRKVHMFMAEGEHSIFDDDVMEPVQELMDEADRLAKELELAAAMETALFGLSECGCLRRNAHDIPSVAAAKAKARDVVREARALKLARKQ